MSQPETFSAYQKVKPQAGVSADPETLHALASYVEREWGGHGYSLTLVGWTAGRIARRDHDDRLIANVVCHLDGARFQISADQFGNTRYLGRL